MTKRRLKKVGVDKAAFTGIPSGMPSKILDLPDNRDGWYTTEGKLKSKIYHKQLELLQHELVKLQGWIQDQGLKVLLYYVLVVVALVASTVVSVRVLPELARLVGVA